MNGLCGSVAGVVALALALGLSTNAFAGKKEDKERQQASIVLVKQAVARHDVGRFDEAIELLLRAYDLWPHVTILLDLGQVYRVKKDYARALFQYRRFLNACKPDDPDRETAEYFAA